VAKILQAGTPSYDPRGDATVGNRHPINPRAIGAVSKFGDSLFQRVWQIQPPFFANQPYRLFAELPAGPKA
jgi:hypothetical protein